jgi:Tol biopolymer transport system component
VGALDIPNTTTFGVTIRNGYPSAQYHVAWSPDGKRFACVQQNTPNPGVTVLVNGKPMGQTYQRANELVWSPDGSRLAYQAGSPTGTFLVLDGQELAGYHWIKEFQWSPDGKRYAFYAANSTGIWMNVDGKEQPKALGFSDGALRFSPVGDHIAYGAQSTVANYQPIVDGVAIPHNLGNFATKTPPNTLFLPVFSYSPDGNHLAYVGAKNDGTSKIAVWVDGVAYPGPLQSYFHPAWSPDSKHFAVVTSNGSGRGWSIMVDGKLSQGYEDIIELNEASSRFVDAHTFRFYAVKGTDVYRVTLDVGG